MTDLISAARRLLASQLPFDVVNTLFEQTLPRQIILNLYPSGQGISPHVDLPARYADGIVGVSLMGGCVMSFTRDQGEKSDKVSLWRPDGSGVEEERHDLYLPPRTIYVLTGPARWDWAHGISSKTEDLVQGESGVQTILRDLRVSATFRWMKEGADILW
jgi:alkylated DNA repair dioxygenase AlkB